MGEGSGSGRAAETARSELLAIADTVQGEFTRERRVLSFDEYLGLVEEEPERHCRDAAAFLKDALDFYGRTERARPWGKEVRFRLFNQPFAEDGEARMDALVGQELVQDEIYRVVSNFVREGRANRVILLHGPNGSAKSTVAACLMRGLEDYSTRDEGALYRYHWVFPSQTTLRGAIGFGGGKKGGASGGSYTHLRDDQVDARLFVEVRDHPLFLLPRRQRLQFLDALYERHGLASRPPRWLTRGTLCHKSRLVFEALLRSYEGDLAEVLRHVQVERYFVSRRYRVGAVTLGPQLSVDAIERQVTADRSLAALPPSLQGLALFEVHGELVDAAGGLLEYSDLLKRPLDAFKYLQITAETGEVALQAQTLQVNCVMLASGNEVHLNAFREHPEFQSFRGRLELVRAPYLRSYHDEVEIYDAQIVPQIRGHVGPHATSVAAMFAVLSRMRRPNPERYPREVREVITALRAEAKMDLYADGRAPAELEEERASTLRGLIGDIYRETEAYPIYEGSTGASPREMRAVLLDAAQDPRYSYLSAFAVLDGIKRLCERTSEYAFLQEEPLPGGYHDHQGFIDILLERLLDKVEDEMRVASGLVEEARYAELFSRYVNHVSYWVKHEQIRNPLTGDYEDPDPHLMKEVESLLRAEDRPEEFRHVLIGRIAAWAIDHPGETVDHTKVFRMEINRLREAVFRERREALAQRCVDLLTVVREEGAGVPRDRLAAVDSTLARLRELYGYEDVSAADAVAKLYKHRYAGLDPRSR